MSGIRQRVEADSAVARLQALGARRPLRSGSACPRTTSSRLTTTPPSGGNHRHTPAGPYLRAASPASAFATPESGRSAVRSRPCHFPVPELGKRSWIAEARLTVLPHASALKRPPITSAETLYAHEE